MIKNLLQKDVEISERLRVDNGQSRLFSIVKILAHSGDSWLWCGVLFVFWLFSTGERERALAWWGGTIAATALFVFFLKKLISRKRPEGVWGEIYRRGDPYSFPSGHAVRGGLIVMLTWGTFHDPAWTVVALIWAVLMMLSRIASGLHYLSDVLAGFLLGICLGMVYNGLQPWVYDTFPLLFDKSSWFKL